MRYVQLRAFHYVAICGGFSRAAEALFLTQPAISDQVRRLEEEYEVVLFNRQKKQVTLTLQGQQLLEVTHRMFDTEQRALDLLSESRALSSGTLRIVADAAHHLLEILGKFRARYPGIHVTVNAGNTESVVASLFNFEADIGVLGEIPARREFDILILNSSPIIAFVAHGHPLADASKLSLAAIVQHPLVLRERGSKTRHKLETLAAAQGIALKPMIEAEGREAVREIVTSGVGVGFVSQAEFGRDERVRPILIDGPEMLMEEALVCLRERSEGKLVKAFWDIARTVSEG
ncbi:MAG: LysR substrate-binding domain-containing protein [Parvibaculaceae bacterium]